jgi:hypothetical protein
MLLRKVESSDYYAIESDQKCLDSRDVNKMLHVETKTLESRLRLRC